MNFKVFIENEDKKARAKELWQQIQTLLKQHGSGLTRQESLKFRTMQAEFESLRHDLFSVREPKIEEILPADQRDSTLSPEVVLTARQDLRSNKAVYLAIADASAGAGFNEDTAIDEIVKGKNPNITFQQFYDTFARTRMALRNQFGNSIILYRAEGRQKTKPTQNWATTESYAKQFGNTVISKNIPIENILAVNVGLKGNYHELIVGNPPKKSN